MSYYLRSMPYNASSCGIFCTIDAVSLEEKPVALFYFDTPTKPTTDTQTQHLALLAVITQLSDDRNESPATKKLRETIKKSFSNAADSPDLGRILHEKSFLLQNCILNSLNDSDEASDHLRSSEIYYSVSNKANYELTSDNRYLQDIKTGRAELGTKAIQVTHIFRGNMPDQREFLSIDINYNHKATIFNIGTVLIAAEHVETILPKLMRTLHTLNHLESNCAKLEHEDNVGLATEIIKRVSGNAGDNTPPPAPNL